MSAKAEPLPECNNCGRGIEDRHLLCHRCVSDRIEEDTEDAVHRAYVDAEKEALSNVGGPVREWADRQKMLGNIDRKTFELFELFELCAEDLEVGK
jgi:hypothetical protein